VRDVRKLNLLLWALNLLLILGTVAFSFRYLLRQERFLADFVVDAGADERREAPKAAVSDASLRLGNPVEARIVDVSRPGSPVFKAQLRGTLPSDDPKVATAFIKSAARNVELIAYVGEAILHEGKPYEEYRGWTLAKVSKDRATFNGPGGLTQELLIDATSGPAGAAPVGVGKPGARSGARAGQPYAAAQFKSKMLMQSDSRVVWQLDSDEVDWAAQNAERILESDLRVSPNGGGGLRIEGVTAGSIGASRGLVAGDVVRDVNGQPLNNVQDFRALMNNPAFKQASGLRVTVERAGKPVVIEYRPMAR
jgi:hypothetical protein